MQPTNMQFCTRHTSATKPSRFTEKRKMCTCATKPVQIARASLDAVTHQFWILGATLQQTLIWLHFQLAHLGHRGRKSCATWMSQLPSCVPRCTQHSALDPPLHIRTRSTFALFHPCFGCNQIPNPTSCAVCPQNARPREQPLVGTYLSMRASSSKPSPSSSYITSCWTRNLVAFGIRIYGSSEPGSSQFATWHCH